mgnify:CR=1 FL=1
MTVKEFIDILNEYNPKLIVRFHNQWSWDLQLLSDYVSTDKKHLEIDIG